MQQPSITAVSRRCDFLLCSEGWHGRARGGCAAAFPQLQSQKTREITSKPPLPLSLAPTSTATILGETQCLPYTRIWQIALVFVRRWEIWGLAAESVVGTLPKSTKRKPPISRALRCHAGTCHLLKFSLCSPAPPLSLHHHQVAKETSSSSLLPRRSPDDISPDLEHDLRA